MTVELNIAITKPYRAMLADVPAEVIVASLPQMAEPLIKHTYEQALSRAKLRHDRKRLRFVEGKITLNGYRLTITPKGPLAHLLDQGVKPHSLQPKELSRRMRIAIWTLRDAGKSARVDAWLARRERGTYGMHPGFPGRHFMPAALQASLPEMQRILDRNTATFLAKAENR